VTFNSARPALTTLLAALDHLPQSADLILDAGRRHYTRPELPQVLRALSILPLPHHEGLGRLHDEMTEQRISTCDYPDLQKAIRGSLTHRQFKVDLLNMSQMHDPVHVLRNALKELTISDRHEPAIAQAAASTLQRIGDTTNYGHKQWKILSQALAYAGTDPLAELPQLDEQAQLSLLAYSSGTNSRWPHPWLVRYQTARLADQLLAQAGPSINLRKAPTPLLHLMALSPHLTGRQHDQLTADPRTRYEEHWRHTDDLAAAAAMIDIIDSLDYTEDLIPYTWNHPGLSKIVFNNHHIRDISWNNPHITADLLVTTGANPFEHSNWAEIAYLLLTPEDLADMPWPGLAHLAEGPCRYWHPGVSRLALHARQIIGQALDPVLARNAQLIDVLEHLETFPGTAGQLADTLANAQDL